MVDEPTPRLPFETVINDSVWFIDDLPDGQGKLLKIVPVATVMTPQGLQKTSVGSAFAIVFSTDGWERFQRDVAAGEKSKVIVASGLGNGNGNGELH